MRDAIYINGSQPRKYRTDRWAQWAGQIFIPKRLCAGATREPMNQMRPVAPLVPLENMFGLLNSYLFDRRDTRARMIRQTKPATEDCKL